MLDVYEEKETPKEGWTYMMDLFSNAMKDCLKEEMNFLQEELSQGDIYMKSVNTIRDERRDQEEDEQPEILTDEDEIPRQSEQVSLLPSIGTALTFDGGDDDGNDDRTDFLSAREDAHYITKVPSKIVFVGSSGNEEQRDDEFQSNTMKNAMSQKSITMSEYIEVIYKGVTSQAPTKLKFVSQRLRLMRHWKIKNKNQTKKVVDITQRKSPLKFRRSILKIKNKE
jgi:hypothetical protein